MTDFAAPDEMPSRADWDAAVRRDLKGRDFDRTLVCRLREGVDVRPLYAASDSANDAHLSRANDQWAVMQRVDAPDVETCRQQISEDVAKGCDGVHLRLDDAARTGSAERQRAGRGGAAIATPYELARALGDVPLATTTILLDAGANGVGAWGLWRAVAARARVPLIELRGGLLHDVGEATLRDGELPAPAATLWDDAAALANDCAAHAPSVRALSVSSVQVHEAGADAVLELAVLAASLVTTLRELHERGLDAERACSQIVCRLAIGTDMFLEVAKLRAARWILDRVAAACGGPTGALNLHVSGSERSLARLDEPVNMLRVSTQALAAVAGGADIITTLPHDAASGGQSRLARRVARNAQLILRDESNAHVVQDPGAGSWTIEHLTEEFASKGWALMQDMERRGGFAACVADGWLRERVDASWTKRERALRTAKSSLVGVSAFPPAGAVLSPPTPDNDALERSLAKRAQAASGELASALAVVGATPGSLDALHAAYAAGASLAAVHAAQGRRATRTGSALECRRDAELFETLRTGDELAATLVFAGREAAVSARASWTRNLLTSGGFGVETAENVGPNTLPPTAGANALVVVCLSDDDFAERLPGIVRALKQSGAIVAVAGHPKNAPALDGVDRWLHVGIDIPDTLAALRAATEAS